MASSDHQRKYERTRNFGVAAHIDAGKTTLTERILFYTGASHKIGEVHDGNTQTDYLPEERERGITITAAVTHCEWKKYSLHLIDTPGHVDFTIEVERSMRVLDGVVMVLDGVKGVEPQTETVWRQAHRYKVPRIVFVNKMDRPGADFAKSVTSLASRLHAQPVPINVPVLTDERSGILDLLEMRWLTFHGDRNSDVTAEPVPPDLEETFQTWRDRLIESLADCDDRIAELYLGGDELPQSLLVEVLRRETLRNRIQPVLGGSALKDLGVQQVLDAVIAFLPTPLDVGTAIGFDSKTQEPVEVALDPKGPTLGFAFKVQMIQGRRHVYIKMYRGRLAAGQAVWNASRGDMERVGHLYNIRADKRDNLEAAEAADIVLVSGLKKVSTGDTLCDPKARVVLEAIQPYKPVMALAVVPVKSSEEDKVLEALTKMVEEDPTLVLADDTDSGQRLLRGMGELHLEVVIERMQREYGVAVRAGRPRVVYRESIGAVSRGEAVVDRVLERGGRQRSRVVVEITPTSYDQPVRELSRLETIAVLPPEVHLHPNQFDWMRETSAQESQTGPVQGYPLVGMDVKIVEVELFGIESNEVALREATARAIRDALHHAEAHLLAPIMFLRVEAPLEAVGVIMGDIQARGGVIQGMNTDETVTVVEAECPMERLFGYVNDLRNQTQGRGTFTLHFARLDRI